MAYGVWFCIVLFLLVATPPPPPPPTTTTTTTTTGNFVGIARQASIRHIKILGKSGGGTLGSIARAIDLVIKHKQAYPNIPMVLSMSLGMTLSSPISSGVIAMEDMLSSAINATVIAVVAAGNSNIDAIKSSPARVSAAITVAATGNAVTFARDTYSNYGTLVDVIAPGTNIASADYQNPTGYQYLSGTSMATPHVAGSVALLMGEYLRVNNASCGTKTASDYINILTKGKSSDKYLRHFLASDVPSATYKCPSNTQK